LKSRIYIVVAMVMLLALLIPVIAGCTPAKTPAAAPAASVNKPKELVIYAIHDMSGPMSVSTLPTVAASEDLVKYLNSKGGIDGVPLRMEWHDTRGDKAVLITEYAKVKEITPKPLTVGVYSSADALATRFAEDKIPCNTTSVSNTMVWPPAWIIGSAGTYGDLTGTFIDWLSADWAKNHPDRKCRLAFFGPDIYVGHDCASPEVMEYIKTKPNIEVVDTEYFDFRALDLSSDILRVMQTNPDYIYGFYFATSGASFYKSLKSSGYAGKVKIGTVLWAMQSDIVNLVGPELMEGVVGTFHVPSLKPKGEKQINDGMELISTLFDQNNHPASYRGGSYVSGMLYYDWVTGILAKAVKDYGWDKLDSTAVYNTFTNTRSLDLGGISSWGCTEGTRYNNKTYMMQFKNGVAEVISDTMTSPDLRPTKYRTTDYNWKGAGWPDGTFK
jgi:ABC-type branched-subunit amino acid transport system substrate-binding protein